MIISASYKTDIPTFYGDWFMNRLRAGSCQMVNPYGGQVYTISLRREDVDGFVFWTKNIGPFLRHLPEIQARGYPFVVQHSLTGYPRTLETHVADPARTVAHLHALRERFGPRVAVWRYDPILFTSLTPPAWHRDNFAWLAEALRGICDEVVISFAQLYYKTRRNLEAAARQQGFTWREHERLAAAEEADGGESAREMVRALAGMAAAQGMRLTICAQPQYLVPGLAEAARCVDAERLSDVAGQPIAASRQTGNRPACACAASRDIGAYDTCPHGCVYCYAVQRRERALARYRHHDPHGAFLFPPGRMPGTG
jgi:hypothetical protein